MVHWKITVINTGHLDLSLKEEDLTSINFVDYFQTYQQLPEINTFYNKENSSIWQMFDEDCPGFIKGLKTLVPRDYDHCVSSVICIPPGQTVPLHRDKHYQVQNIFGVGETHRYLIFLQDWKSGHYFEIEGRPMVEWKAGDWIRFTRSQWHLAGNMGVKPFYSAQITCVVL